MIKPAVESDNSVELTLLRRLEHASRAPTDSIEVGRLKTALAVLRESYPELARVVYLKSETR